MLRFVVGILLVSRPLLGAEAITLLLAALFLVGGSIRAVTSVFLQLPGWGWMLLNGIVTLWLGLLILNQWPSSAIWVIGLFVGIDLLFDGWSMIAVALAAHRIPPCPRRPGETPAPLGEPGRLANEGGARAPDRAVRGCADRCRPFDSTAPPQGGAAAMPTPQEIRMTALC